MMFRASLGLIWHNEICIYSLALGNAGILRKLSTQPELLQDEVKLQKALRFCLCAGIIAQWTKGAIRGMPTESAAQNLTEQVYPHHMIF